MNNEVNLDNIYEDFENEENKNGYSIDEFIEYITYHLDFYEFFDYNSSFKDFASSRFNIGGWSVDYIKKSGHLCYTTHCKMITVSDLEDYLTYYYEEKLEKVKEVLFEKVTRRAVHKIHEKLIEFYFDEEFKPFVKKLGEIPVWLKNYNDFKDEYNHYFGIVLRKENGYVSGDYVEFDMARLERFLDDYIKNWGNDDLEHALFYVRDKYYLEDLVKRSEYLEGIVDKIDDFLMKTADKKNRDCDDFLDYILEAMDNIIKKKK